MRLNIVLAAAAATLVVATPAAAQQAKALATAQGTILQSLTLVKATDLDFGTIAPDATNAGTVSMDPDTGVRTLTNAVGLAGTYTLASFTGRGAVGQTVQITLHQPGSNQLTSGSNVIGATLKLDSTSAAPTISIPTGGKFTVNVGGDFAIAANQASGLYSAQFDVVADYQ